MNARSGLRSEVSGVGTAITTASISAKSWAELVARYRPASIRAFSTSSSTPSM